MSEIASKNNCVWDERWWKPVPGSYISLGWTTPFPQIDFGFKIASDDYVLIQAMKTVTDVWACLFTTGSNDVQTCEEWQISVRYTHRYFNQGGKDGISPFGEYNDTSTIHVFEQAGNKWYRDGVLLCAWPVVNPPCLTSGTLKTHAYDKAASAHVFHGLIYHVQHKDASGNLLNDLWPREIGGVAGMFDKVTADFRTSSQGEITYGEPKGV